MSAGFRVPLLAALVPSAILAAFLNTVGLNTAARADAAADADRLYQRAQAYVDRNTVETRRMAMDCLERATLLAPREPEYQLALGRVYYAMGFLKEARQRFQKVERLDPKSADARLGIGQVWRRDWLKYLDRTSLAKAIDNITTAAQIEPARCDAWLALVPLLFENDDLAGAGRAAEMALRAERNRPDALLAVAYTSFRLGGIGRAESSFVAAIPRLPRNVRERFDDIAPVSSESDTATLRRLPAAERPEFLRRFWREHDPDLASPENEAQLEYWSRVTQAFFLYYDHKRREWDQRGEVYVRYGPPERAEYNPIGAPSAQVFSTGPAYPLNTLVWAYPSLGMTVSMQDRLLSEYYLMPISRYEDMDPRPDPQVLARRADLLPARDGRGVFPVLPPGARPLPVEGVLARFSGVRGPRLFGQVAIASWPSDSLVVDWVVLDTAMAEVARARRHPGVSECDPAGMRVADFAADLGPGRYVIGMTARDPSGRRGVYRAPVELRGTPAALSLSDAMVLCGRPAVEGGSGGVPPAVRLEADPGAVVTGADPLGVYFEMYDLRPDETGTSRFEYECTVSSAEKDPRIWIQRLLQPRPRIPEISAGRREEQAGNLRRQYVTVPIASLKDGRYKLNVRVRDLNAGSEATTSVEFVKRAGG